LSIRIAIAQCAPALGAVQRNLDMHDKWIARARAAGARLVIFPELSLTGYYLKDLAADVAVAADDPQLSRIAEASRDIDISAGFVERSADAKLHIAQGHWSGGKLVHVHRKVYLPTYGIFDDGRYFGPGDRFETYRWAGGTTAAIVVDNSVKPDAANGAVYKGATIAEIDGKEYILAANFRSGRVDIFDSTFKQVQLGKKDFDGDGDRDSRAPFDDDSIPKDFAPFNIQGIGPNIYITYAKQDAAKHDPVGGAGLGFVDVFTSEGRRLQRLQHGSWFNAPWGTVLASSNFGEFSHTILIGNFRGGTIAAFNPVTGRFMGNVLNPDGSTLNIDGLWGLQFGNGGSAGPAETLFFTAGPNGEKDGLFGTLTPITSELNEKDEQ